MSAALEAGQLLAEADHVAVRDAEHLLQELDEQHLQNACSQIDPKPFSEQGRHPPTP